MGKEFNRKAFTNASKNFEKQMRKSMDSIAMIKNQVGQVLANPDIPMEQKKELKEAFSKLKDIGK